MYKVMLVDDDSVFAETAASNLVGSGFTVVMETDSGKAFDKICAEQPDALLLDVRMPGMDGLELLSKVREKEAKENAEVPLPVIMLTAYDDENAPVQALKLKADDFVFKPFDHTVLMHSIARCLQLSALRKEKIEYSKQLEKKVEERTKEIEAARKKVQELNRELVSRISKTTGQLEEAYKKISENEKMAFFGKVAYGFGTELKSPLTSLSNVCFYMQMNCDKKDPKMMKFLELFQTEIKKMGRIIEDLFYFAQAKTHEKRPRVLNELLDEIISGLDKPQGVEIERDYKETLEPLSFDEEGVGKMINSLFENACEAMGGKGKVTISLSSEINAGLGICQRIDFSDTGKGIGGTVKGDIFDPLYTVKAKGLGLGLGIVRDVVNNHSGKVSFSSRENEGTTFTILFPLESA